MEGRSRNHHRYKNLSLCTLTESHFSSPALMKLIFDMVVKGQEVGGEHKAFVRGLSLLSREQTTRKSCRVPSIPSLAIPEWTEGGLWNSTPRGGNFQSLN